MDDGFLLHKVMKKMGSAIQNVSNNFIKYVKKHKEKAAELFSWDTQKL